MAKSEGLLENRSLYEVLGVEKTATANEIKKAYHKLALSLHPDRNKEDKDATEKFQTLQRVYEVLSDEEKRRVYDQTGSLEDSEELAGKKFNDLYEYYRSMYCRVTEDDIVKFQESYRHSEEESASLELLYERFKGDMQMVFAFQLCSDEASDSHRFADHIEAQIKAGVLKSYKKFSKWCVHVRSRPPPTVTKDTVSKKGSKKKKQKEDSAGGMGDLMAMIQGRSKQREQQTASFFASLEAKYAGQDGEKKSSKKGRGKQTEMEAEPSEEDFLAARERLAKKKSPAKRHKNK
uniref:J domain-containing protein n=1 Tax=Pyramimonas obovata TaxID=1411642 RepID=A0A7S0N8C1_9CHLO|mmetsp:Transcript_21556/g.47304  ORF Transcript_21556/g.47304 Transcript_21556/m.47304 type:complete len:292 (+) Transcript_21556:108-983(+)